MLPSWSWGSFEKAYKGFQVKSTTPTHQFAALIDGCPMRGGSWLRGCDQIVTLDDSTSIGMEMHGGLFHSSFVVTRQLWKGFLPSLSSYYHHSHHSPTKMSLLVGLEQSFRNTAHTTALCQWHIISVRCPHWHNVNKLVKATFKIELLVELAVFQEPVLVLIDLIPAFYAGS